MPININGTTGISGADGSAATPSIQGSDTNTGIFFPAADTVAVATGGSEAMRIDTSRNVGIGTSSPTSGYKLDVAGNLAFSSVGANDSGLVAFAANPSTAFRFSLTRQDAIAAGSVYLNAFGGIGFGSGKGATGTPGSAPNMFLDSSGNLLVGTTSNSCGGFAMKSHFDATSSSGGGVGITGNASVTQVMRFAYTTTAVGSINITNSTTSYATTSDYRLKEDVQPMVGALAKVAALKPVTYKWKADGSDGQGFIAHELQEIAPDAVVGEKDAVDADGNPVYQGIDTSFLVATLTAAIQELKAIVDAQAVEIAALKGAA